MQIMNREKNTKSLSPTQFSQTQDIPVGKHRQQKRILQKESLAAERRKCKQRKLSEKNLLHSRYKTLRMGI